MNQKKYPIMNVGTASILTVFIVLAMMTFATLTYMSARKDAHYAQESAEASRQYQEAVNQAYAQIAGIDANLLNHYRAGTFDALVGTDYSFTVPITDDAQLQVTLVPCQLENGSLYRITSFQKVRTKQWENDNTLPLMELQ